MQSTPPWKARWPPSWRSNGRWSRPSRATQSTKQALPPMTSTLTAVTTSTLTAIISSLAAVTSTLNQRSTTRIDCGLCRRWGRAWSLRLPSSTTNRPSKRTTRAAKQARTGGSPSKADLEGTPKTVNGLGPFRTQHRVQVVMGTSVLPTDCVQALEHELVSNEGDSAHGIV